MEEKLVSRLVQIGIRTLNPHQRKQAQRFGVEIIVEYNPRRDPQEITAMVAAKILKEVAARMLELPVESI